MTTLITAAEETKLRRAVNRFTVAIDFFYATIIFFFFFFFFFSACLSFIALLTPHTIRYLHYLHYLR